MSGDASERLRALTGMIRSRNGRLAIDWISRRQMQRYRMLRSPETGQWYDRRRLAGERALPRGISRRDADDADPWRLWNRKRNASR